MASTVQLGSVYLDIDPEVITPLSARRRGSVHQLIDTGDGVPGTVYQDRGVLESDHIIRVKGALFDNDTAKALWALYRQKGAQHTFNDLRGNEFTVVFTPGEVFDCSPIYGSSTSWKFEMSLSVVSVEMWFNSSLYPAED